MQYKGILCRNGVNTRTGERCWYVKLRDPQRGELESIRGDSPEDTVNKVFERGLQSLAEQAPVQPAPQQQTVVRPAGPRIRPGSLR